MIPVFDFLKFRGGVLYDLQEISGVIIPYSTLRLQPLGTWFSTVGPPCYKIFFESFLWLSLVKRLVC